MVRMNRNSARKQRPISARTPPSKNIISNKSPTSNGTRPHPPNPEPNPPLQTRPESDEDSDAPEEIPQAAARETSHALHHSQLEAHRDLQQRRKARRRARSEAAELAATKRADSRRGKQVIDPSEEQPPVLLPDDVLDSAHMASRQEKEDIRQEKVARRMQEQHAFVKPLDDVRVIGDVHVAVAGEQVALSVPSEKRKRRKLDAADFFADSTQSQPSLRVSALKAVQVATKAHKMRY